LSDNIEVISVVGRFLEHARIYYFRNGGDEEYYVGSADIMGRNLKSRVEVLAPIELPALREELRYFIDSQLADNRGAWVMLADGGYERREPSGDKKARSCQAMMIDYAEKRLRQATRLRKRKPKGLFRRNTSR
jgi:polyphosphate kinase